MAQLELFYHNGRSPKYCKFITGAAEQGQGIKNKRKIFSSLPKSMKKLTLILKIARWEHLSAKSEQKKNKSGGNKHKLRESYIRVQDNHRRECMSLPKVYVIVCHPQKETPLS